jgi:outer membrane lipoprotein-sorting protein
MSRTRRGLVALAVGALLAVTLVSAAAKAPTVDEIVARYVTVRGGLSTLRSIQTLRQTGHADAGANRQARIIRELKRPDLARFEFTVQGVTAVYVADGERGWGVSPFEGSVDPKPLSEEVVQDAAEQADIEGPLVDWKAKGHHVELVGQELVGGRQAHKLKLTLASGDVRYEYIHVKSHHLVRTDSTRQVRGRAVQFQTTFSDHKRTGGVLFPHVIEIEAAGRPEGLRVVLDKVEINAPLSDARFEMAVP